MAMLARNRNLRGKIHSEDCFCCNDGFWKVNNKNKRKIHKQNRRLENKQWRNDLKIAY